MIPINLPTPDKMSGVALNGLSPKHATDADCTALGRTILNQMADGYEAVVVIQDLPANYPIQQEPS